MKLVDTIVKIDLKQEPPFWGRKNSQQYSTTRLTVGMKFPKNTLGRKTEIPKRPSTKPRKSPESTQKVNNKRRQSKHATGGYAS